MCFVNECKRSSLKLKFEVVSEHLNSIPYSTPPTSPGLQLKRPFETEGPFETEMFVLNCTSKNPGDGYHCGGIDGPSY